MRTIVLVFSLIALAAPSHAAPRTKSKVENAASTEKRCHEMVGQEQYDGEGRSLMLPSWQKAVSRLKSRPAFPNRRRLHKPSNPDPLRECCPLSKPEAAPRGRAMPQLVVAIERPSDVISLLIQGDANDAAVTTELAAALERCLHSPLASYKRNAIPDS
jgi:hypothetical protein